MRVEWNQHFVFRKAEVINNRQAWWIHPRYTDMQRCLDVTNGTSNGGEQLQIWSCHSGWQQQFHVEEAGNGRFRIKPSYNGWCLTANYPTTGDLVPIRQYQCPNWSWSSQEFLLQRA
ncbi:RICIN domain-containing protein [Planomonospora sp. ID67723]|uniref:RICIN domain-containing protein n=1 Tax=Planomonospora sp. ID67723 TaxID=2738134 RepID=UPI0018C422A3|nr:RICIN domain-containing protein [Planomonospora sp. ID67723]MBG0831778.1 RICIN domain-containing protein [Planomonospora sp. ID67723]